MIQNKPNANDPHTNRRFDSNQIWLKSQDGPAGGGFLLRDDFQSALDVKTTMPMNGDNIRFNINTNCIVITYFIEIIISDDLAHASHNIQATSRTNDNPIN